MSIYERDPTTGNLKVISGKPTVFTGATESADGQEGIVPQPLMADKDKFLKGNGGWSTPTDTTYSAFTGATSQAAGTEGLVPQPIAGDQDKVLTGGGTWKSDTANLTTTYTTEDDANTTAIITSAGGETAISTMESGAKHSRLFNKVSRTVLNTRKLINTVKRIWATVATSWASGETYAVGDVRLWTNGHTYVCKLAHTSSSSITPANTTYWEDKTLGDMISSLNSNWRNKEAPVSMSNIDLSAYTVASGNKYTCPTDGYAFINGITGTTATCRIYATDNNTFTYFTTLNITSLVPVRKGMLLCGENFSVFRFIKFNY